MKLIIGNKAYSSWSLRGWLACKQSGLAFEEVVVPMYDDDWPHRRQGDDLRPSAGKVPTLWDGDAVVWDSIALVDYLADKVGRERFWPVHDAARAMARSMAAEMHAGFTALRREHSMNVRRVFPARPPSAEVTADLTRILALWSDARTRFGNGSGYLFGDFGAADIMFAPVCSRIVTYQLPVSGDARAYVDAVIGHSWIQDWISAAHDEPWVIEQYEHPVG